MLRVASLSGVTKSNTTDAACDQSKSCPQEWKFVLSEQIFLLQSCRKGCSCFLSKKGKNRCYLIISDCVFLPPLEQVMVNGVEHKPTFASPSKKLAKATAATVALQALGIVPKELLANATSFRSASHN